MCNDTLPLVSFKLCTDNTLSCIYKEDMAEDKTTAELLMQPFFVLAVSSQSCAKAPLSLERMRDNRGYSWPLKPEQRPIIIRARFPKTITMKRASHSSAAALR